MTEKWEDLGINIDLEKHEILNILAREIFVKEHKFRWPVEQRERLERTIAVFNPYELNNKSVFFFLNTYNWLIHTSVESSHLFRSPVIKGDSSFLE